MTSRRAAVAASHYSIVREKASSDAAVSSDSEEGATGLRRGSKGTRNVRPIAAGILAGAIASLVVGTSQQQSYAPLLVCVAHALAFRAVDSARGWCTYGVAYGGTFAAPLVLSLAPHGWQLAMGAPLLCTFLVALGFGASALFGSVLRVPAPIAIPFGWGVVCTALDHAGLSPVSLFVGLLKLSPWTLLPVQLLGIYGLDAVLLAICASVALARTRAYQALSLSLVIGYGVLCVAASPRNSPSMERMRVAVVQPNIPMSEHQAAGWSLVTRRIIRGRLETLVERATAQGAGLIVLPENAAGSPEIQLQHRVQDWASTLTNDRQKMVLSSNVHYHHASFSAVALLGQRGIEQLSYKAKPLPFAEGDLQSGSVGVFEAEPLRIGVLICFDSMFGDVWRDLARQGAELAVLVSNDESFGLSSTVIGHVLVTRLRAMEMGLPLAVSSNAGPSFLQTADGRIETQLEMAERGTVSAILAARGRPTVASGNWRWLIFVLLCSPFLVAALRPGGAGRRSISDVRQLLASVVGAFLVALFIGVCADLLSGFVWHSADPWRRVSIVAARGFGEQAIEGLGPAFLQSAKDRCGAAALAFAMTRMGQTAFEEDTVKRCPQLAGTASLRDLEICARRNGFYARSVWSAVPALPKTRHGSLLMHLRHGHFVVLLKLLHSEAIVFDPAKGSVDTVSLRDLIASSSGYALELAYPEPPNRFTAESR